MLLPLLQHAGRHLDWISQRGPELSGSYDYRYTGTPHLDLDSHPTDDALFAPNR